MLVMGKSCQQCDQTVRSLAALEARLGSKLSANRQGSRQDGGVQRCIDDHSGVTTMTVGSGAQLRVGTLWCGVLPRMTTRGETKAKTKVQPGPATKPKLQFM